MAFALQQCRLHAAKRGRHEQETYSAATDAASSMFDTFMFFFPVFLRARARTICVRLSAEETTRRVATVAGLKGLRRSRARMSSCGQPVRFLSAAAAFAVGQYSALHTDPKALVCPAHSRLLT